MQISRSLVCFCLIEGTHVNAYFDAFDELREAIEDSLARSNFRREEAERIERTICQKILLCESSGENLNVTRGPHDLVYKAFQSEVP